MSGSTPAEDFVPIASDREAIERIEEHVYQHIGEGEVFHELLSEVVHVDVHVLDPTPQRDFYTLVTTGMSDLPMQATDGARDPRYAELIMCLPSNWSLTDDALRREEHVWPIHLLQKLARQPHRQRSERGAGHVSSNVGPPQPFASNTKLCGVLLSTPKLFAPGFERIEVRPDKTVQLLSVIPIYREESEFVQTHGVDVLLDLLAMNGVTELLDVHRKRVC